VTRMTQAGMSKKRAPGAESCGSREQAGLFTIRVNELLHKRTGVARFGIGVAKSATSFRTRFSYGPLFLF
jgi:hypothetical protein